MKIEEIIGIANKAYPDNMIQEAWEEVNGGERCGDTLALFIVRELKDAVDEADPEPKQLRDAARAMSKAAQELRDVTGAFVDMAAEIGEEVDEEIP